MKKIGLLLLLIPALANANLISYSTNDEFAKRCIQVRKNLEMLINIQNNDQCKIDLMHAKLYTDNAIHNLVQDKTIQAKENLIDAKAYLKTAEFDECMSTPEIKKNNIEVSNIISELG